MERIKYFFLGILALSLVGCGQTVVETLHVPENPGHNAPGVGKTIVILPFADYSEGNSFASAQRRNMMVTESLTDRFLANGFSLPVQEDVFQYLVAEDIIQLYDTNKSSSISAALADSDWSDVMKGELQRYQAEQSMQKGDSPTDAPGAHGLTPKAIAKIGHDFNADYVVRGRILEFKTREDTSWEPWKKGLLPFVNNGTSRILFGFADSEEYDVFNNMATGALLGAMVGNNVSSPVSDNQDNMLIWGGGGLVAGNMNYHSGKVDQAAVQMRVWIQETSTGKVVWTNRVMVKVSPESVLADNQYDVLFNRAIEQGVAKLIDNFVVYTFM